MWIEKQRQSNIPFFAYISTNAPHGPMLAPSQYKKRFAEDGWDEIIQERYGMIENIDDNLGKLMNKMDQWGAGRYSLHLHDR